MTSRKFRGNTITLAKIEGTRFYKLEVNGDEKDVVIDGILFEGNIASTMALRSSSEEKQVLTIPSHHHDTDEPHDVVIADTVHEAFNEYDDMDDLDKKGNEHGWHHVRPVYEVETYGEGENTGDLDKEIYANCKIRKLGYVEKDHSDTPEDRPKGEKPEGKYLEVKE